MLSLRQDRWWLWHKGHHLCPPQTLTDHWSVCYVEIRKMLPLKQCQVGPQFKGEPTKTRWLGEQSPSRSHDTAERNDDHTMSTTLTYSVNLPGTDWHTCEEGDPSSQWPGAQFWALRSSRLHIQTRQCAQDSGRHHSCPTRLRKLWLLSLAKEKVLSIRWMTRHDLFLMVWSHFLGSWWCKLMTGCYQINKLNWW